VIWANILVFAIFCIYTNYTKNIDLTAIMILFAWIFSIGQLLLEILNISEQTSISSSFDDTIIAKGSLYVALSMGLFTIGALIAQNRGNRAEDGRTPIIKIDHVIFMRISKVFFAIGVVPMIIYLGKCLVYVFAFGYGASIYNDGVVTDGSFFIGLKNYFTYSLYMLICGYGSENIKKAKAILFVGFAYCGALIMVGQRLTVIAYLIGLLFCYHYSVESLRKYKHLIGLIGVIGILVLPVLSSYRLVARSQWSISAILDQMDFMGGLTSILAETGGSIAPLLNCMSDSRLLNMELNGASYLDCMALSVMFSSIVRMFYNPGYTSLQLFYTRLIAPAIASVGGGLGFSMFAEAYLNFHEIGVIIIGLFGYLYTKMLITGINAYQNNNRFWLPMVLFLGQRLLFYVRSDLYDFYGNFKMVLIITFISFAISNIIKWREQEYLGGE
jgi:oligosaccharide repeat unit polymerase